MQHGGMFVQRHNVAVWDIGIAMSRSSGQVRPVDEIKLAHAGTEGTLPPPDDRSPPFSALRAYRPSS